LLPDLCENDVAAAAPREVMRSPLVLCRFRAQSATEESKGLDAWDLGHETVIGKEGVCCNHVISRSDVTTFTFDRVFGPEASQEEVYHHVKPHINEVLRGVNCAVLCYGQTSAGKTYTMVGPRDSSSCDTWGIVPRTLASFYEASRNDDCHFRLSMLEIYMERLIDLLNPHGSSRLRILEDHVGKVVVHGLHEARVDNYMDALSTFWKGQQRRTTAATGMNDLSSRSHCIFILTVERSGQAASKLYLVDLAGSESIKKAAISGADQDFSTIAANMELSEESKAINQSLSTLGLVLNRLAERRKLGIGNTVVDRRRTSGGAGFSHETHIPYRSSKLTRVLQDVLSGNARIALIINCSMSSLQAAETLSTLRFGRRARLLTTTVKPMPSPPLEPAMLLSRTLKTARQEIQRLRHLAGAQIGVSTPAKPNDSISGDSEDQDSWLSLTPIPHSAPPAPTLRLPLAAVSRQVPSHFDLDSSTCWDLTPREPDSLTPDIRPRRLQFFHGVDPSPSGRRQSAAMLASPPCDAKMSLDDLSAEVHSPCWEYPMTRRESSMRALFAQKQICVEAVNRLKAAEAELEWLQWLSPGEADLMEPILQVEQEGEGVSFPVATRLAVIPDVAVCDPPEEAVAAVAEEEPQRQRLEEPDEERKRRATIREASPGEEASTEPEQPQPETLEELAEDQSCPEKVPEDSCVHDARATAPELVPEIVLRDSKDDTRVPQETDIEIVDVQLEPASAQSCTIPRQVIAESRRSWVVVPLLVVASAFATRAAALWL